MSLDRAFEKRLAGVINARAKGVLQGGLKGVERESLRVTPKGQISKARIRGRWARRLPTSTSRRTTPKR